MLKEIIIGVIIDLIANILYAAISAIAKKNKE